MEFSPSLISHQASVDVKPYLLLGSGKELSARTVAHRLWLQFVATVGRCVRKSRGGLEGYFRYVSSRPPTAPAVRLMTELLTSRIPDGILFYVSRRVQRWLWLSPGSAREE